jgi:hypothetical protein
MSLGMNLLDLLNKTESGLIKASGSIIESEDHQECTDVILHELVVTSCLVDGIDSQEIVASKGIDD